MAERLLDRQPIPTEARCVFRGEIFDIYQWDQKLYDGSIAVFEKLRRADTVAVLPVTKSGEILLIEEEQPGKKRFWSAPGGRVDPGETLEQAALRELLEETGFQPQTLERWYTVQPVSKIDWQVHIFLARGCEKTAESALDGGERIACHLVIFDQLMEVVLTDQYYDLELKNRFLEAKIDPEKMAHLRQFFGQGG